MELEQTLENTAVSGRASWRLPARGKLLALAILRIAVFASLATLTHAQEIPWTNTIQSLLDNVVNVIAPAMGIIGFIAVGGSLILGETGRVFKIGLGVVIGATIMAQAQNIWSSVFGGAG